MNDNAPDCIHGLVMQEVDQILALVFVGFLVGLAVGGFYSYREYRKKKKGD